MKLTIAIRDRELVTVRAANKVCQHTDEGALVFLRSKRKTALNHLNKSWFHPEFLQGFYEEVRLHLKTYHCYCCYGQRLLVGQHCVSCFPFICDKSKLRGDAGFTGEITKFLLLFALHGYSGFWDPS